MLGARPHAAIRRQSSMLAPSVPIKIAFFAGPGRSFIAGYSVPMRANPMRRGCILARFRHPRAV